MLEIFLGAETLSSTIRLSVPLILACLAGLWSERSGIVDIGLEGKMLAAAFAAAAAAAFTGNAWLALLLAIACLLAFSLVHGYASINQRGNQVVSGVAINMLAAGLAVVLGNEWFKEGGRTPPLACEAPVSCLSICRACHALYDVPVLGIVARIISGHSILDLSAPSRLVPLTAWALAKTRFGLRLRAVGENPHAVDTAGISVARLRYQAVIIAGVSVRHRRHLYFDVTVGQFRARHDGRPWLHGACRFDLRQLAGLACHVGLSVVRLSASHGHAAAGRSSLAALKCRCSSSTCCPMS